MDGTCPSLACGTTGGKVFIHSPHEQRVQLEDGQLSATKTLNFDKANAEAKVDALGNVIEEKPEDVTKDMSEKEKRKEIKNLQKQIKDGRKKGTLNEDEIMDLEAKIDTIQESLN